MLSPSDRLRSRFALNDPVYFGSRPPRCGTLIRFNKTTATVQCDDSTDSYHIPFTRLKHRMPHPPNSAETQMEAVDTLAHQLLKKYGLKNWGFKFDPATRRAGCCNYRDQVISISFDLARNAAAPDIFDTLLHEIAHALVGKKNNHNAVWKEKVLDMGGTGRRTHCLVFSPSRYQVTCENKCWTHTAERRNPRLICRNCGEKVVYISRV